MVAAVAKEAAVANDAVDSVGVAVIVAVDV